MIFNTFNAMIKFHYTYSIELVWYYYYGAFGIGVVEL